MRRNRFRIRGFILLAVALVLCLVAGLSVYRGYVRVGPSGLPKRYVTRAEDPRTFWVQVAFPAGAGAVLAAFAAFNFRLGRRAAAPATARSQPAGGGPRPKLP